jgi:hypothetical protein
MKKVCVTILAIAAFLYCTGQSNVFPTPSGNVSIGAGTSPQAPLHVLNNSNTPSILLESSSAGWGSGMTFKNTAGTGGRTYGIYSGAYGSFQISDNNLGVNRFLIASNGNVGINVDAPWSKLDVRTAGLNGGDQAALNVQNPSGAGYATVSIALGSGDNFSQSMISAQRSNLGKGSSLFFQTTDNAGSLIPRMWINDAGNVGIGTISPISRLTIAGSAQNDGMWLTGTGTTNMALLNNITAGAYNPLSQAGDNLFLWKGSSLDNTNAGGLVIGPWSGSDNGIRISANGKVGIGTNKTSDFGYKLFVEEGIRTRKIRVDIGQWADDVFNKDYPIWPLAEVEEYIKNHKHLPDVPSAKEVKANGLDLGENQAILLRKIEELTLYIIEQDKRINEISKKIEERDKNMGQFE